MNQRPDSPLPPKPILVARYGAIAFLLAGVAIALYGCFLIPNLPPSARIIANVLAGQPPLSVQFDGTSSMDEDGIVCAYFWSFGDSVTSESMRPTHVYTLPGVYAVTLIVTDNNGTPSSASLTVIVAEPNASPIAAFTTVPSAVVPGEITRFDASGSLDEDGWIVSYQWDFGEGTVAQGSVVEHQFSAPGTYSVVLTVVDNDDAVTTIQSEILVIDTNQAPQPQFDVSAIALDPGEPMICSADGSIDPDGTIVSFDWQFGDGAQAEGSTVTHIYVGAGTYRVTLTATDDLGAKQSITRTVTVGTPADSSLPEPSPSPLPSDGIPLSFRWSYGEITRSLSMSVPESLYEYYQS